MTDRDPATPSDQSTAKVSDQQATDEEMLKDLKVPDAQTVKGGAVNAYLIIDNPPTPTPPKTQ